MLSSFMLPLTCGVHSVILYFLLKKFTEFTQPKIIKICLGLFALQPIYALLFVKAYDSFKRSWKKLKFLFLRTFKKDIYVEFNRDKKELQKCIMEMIDQLGSKVVDNFEENRILKKEEINVSESQLYIFDEEKDGMN